MSKTFIQKLDGMTHQVLLNEEGEIIEVLDVVQSCRAKSGKLRCCLDAVHKLLGTKHLSRTPEGELIAFRTEKELEKVSSTIATEKEQ